MPKFKKSSGFKMKSSPVKSLWGSGAITGFTGGSGSDATIGAITSLSKSAKDRFTPEMVPTVDRYGGLTGGTSFQRSQRPRSVGSNIKESHKSKGGIWDSPFNQDYVKDRHHPKFNPTGTKDKTKIKTPKSYEFKTSTNTVPKIKDVTGKKLTNIILKGDKLPIEKITKKHATQKAIKQAAANQIKKKAKKKAIIKAGKKIASKFLGPVGTALTGVEVIKTIPKVVKATKKSLKKQAKTRFKGRKI